MAALMEIRGENIFKVRAYQNAARALENLTEDLDELIEKKTLTSIPGIGKNLSDHITELRKTGSLKEYTDLRKSVPDGVVQMLSIQGLGPKKVKAIWEKLGITSVAELELICRQGRLAVLEGFGKKTEEKILQGIQFLKGSQGKHLFADAYGHALDLLNIVNENPATIRAEIAGSLRRKKEVIGDIDILASSNDPEPIMDAFTTHPNVMAVTAKGATKSSVILKCGINADLRVVSDGEYPYALHYFTGSQQHNIAMRKIAKDHDMKLSEYGLFKGTKNQPCKNEEEIFKKLGLSYIEPELREDRGEIEEARSGTLPHLIEWKDIRGILHVHSNYSDGTAEIEEMAEAARDLGMEYLGMADHSVSASYAGGLTEEEVEKQHREIDRLNKKLGGFKILKGIECDIKADGTLDYSKDILKKFDFVIAAIHSGFTMGEEEMTKRIVRAMENEFCTMLAHPTGRLLLSRDGYAVDMKKILDCAERNSVAIEINSNPYRLDLDWRWCKTAKEKGIKLSINPDAHSADGLQHTMFGVGIARKGWLEKDDVLNTMSAKDLIRYFKRD